MNLVVLCGRLCDEPSIRTTPAGKKVCDFRIAIQEGRDQPTEFFTCVAWESAADFVSKYIRKGERTLVRGRLRTRSYDPGDGITRYVTEVVCDRVEFADGKVGSDGVN